MVAELHEAFERRPRSQARVVLLRGAGKDFCAGADLAQLERIAAGTGPLENLTTPRPSATSSSACAGSKPIVAAVHGNAFAGGAGLATACDIVLASEDSRFGYPEVHLGFVPAMVMALLRRACGEKIAFELVARGDRIDAAEAHRLGLVNRVLPAATFEADSVEYARELAGRSPSALRLIKRLFYEWTAPPSRRRSRAAEVNVPPG